MGRTNSLPRAALAVLFVAALALPGRAAQEGADEQY